jgi:uncharacterized integral membrane protein
MQIFLFFALFIAILAIIFAVQNNETTTVSFFLWDTNGSLALVLLIAMAAGALISYLASLPSNIKTRLAVRNLRKKVEELEITLEKNRQIIEDSKMEEKSTKPEKVLSDDQERTA